MLYYIDEVRFPNHVFQVYVLTGFLLGSYWFLSGDKILCYDCRFIDLLFQSIFLIYFEVSLLGEHTLRIVLPSWWIDTFIIMKCFSLSLAKFVLYISVAVLVTFGKC